MACIYIAQGEGGLFKVGMTSAISRRKNALKQEFRKKGDVLARMQLLAEVDDDFARSAEHTIVRLVMGLGFAPCSGREWFRGVVFDEVQVKSGPAIKEAIRFCKRFYKTPQQLEELREERKRQKDAANESRRIWRLEAEARAQRRRILRSGPDRCFDHIACAALNGMSSLDLPKRTPKKAEA